jgi:drug/metabolite transporter (DMT)-like permease
MLLGCLFLAGVNVCAKALTETYSIPQIAWARYTFHILLLVVVFGRKFPDLLITTHLGWQSFRSAMMVIATACYFTGISYISLADASALMFVVPIMVTAFSAPFLKERVGIRRWIGVLCGFIGAMIIVRPGFGVMQAGALFMIGSAISQTLYQLITRRVSDTDSPATSLVYSALFGVVIMSAVAPFFWVEPDLKAWSLMVLMGASAGTGHFALIKAFSAAPAPTVAPYFYSHLIWSVLFGFAVFDNLPDPWTVTGAAIIACSGLYIYHRERVRRANAGGD